MLYKGKEITEYTNEYLEKNNVSKMRLSEDIGVSRPLLSRYLNGNYGSDSENVETALIRYFEASRPSY